MSASAFLVGRPLSSFIGPFIPANLQAKETRLGLVPDFNGAFKLPNDYQLKFQTQSASDKSYLSTYRFHASPRETFTGGQIQFVPDRLSTKLFISPSTNQNGLHMEIDYFSPLLSQSAVYETANMKFNLRYTDALGLEKLPGNIKL